MHLLLVVFVEVVAGRDSRRLFPFLRGTRLVTARPDLSSGGQLHQPLPHNTALVVGFGRLGLELPLLHYRPLFDLFLRRRTGLAFDDDSGARFCCVAGVDHIVFCVLEVFVGQAGVNDDFVLPGLFLQNRLPKLLRFERLGGQLAVSVPDLDDSLEIRNC